MTSDDAIQAFLVYSGEHDLHAAARLAAWRDGWQACQQHLGDTYDTGYTDAQLDRKALEHGAVRDLAQHLITWDGPRERFGDPRPGDHPGGPVEPW